MEKQNWFIYTLVTKAPDKGRGSPFEF